MHPQTEGTPFSSLERFKADLKKMLPVWLMMVVLVLGSLWAIRMKAIGYLEAGIIESSHAPSVAEVAYDSGVHEWRKLVAKIEEGKKSDPLFGKLGELKGNPILAKAKERFEKALLVYPTTPDAHTKLAQLEYWDGNEAEAYYHLGEEALLAANYVRAEINFLNASKIEPENIKYTISLSANYARQEKWSEAKALAQSFANDVANNAEASRLLARIEIAENDLNAATEHIENALKADPSNSEGYEIYFSLFQNSPDVLERLKWVEKNLEQTTAITPTTYHRIALIYKYNGAYEDSLRVYNKLTTVASQNVRILIEKAFVEAELGKREQARFTLDRALSLDYGIFIDYFQEKQFDSIRELAPKISDEEAN